MEYSEGALFFTIDRAMDGERAFDRRASTGEAGEASRRKVICGAPSSSLSLVTGDPQDGSEPNSSPGKRVDSRPEGENLSREAGLSGHHLERILLIEP